MRETKFFIFQAPRQHHHLHQERSPSRWKRKGGLFLLHFQALLGHLCNSGHPQAGQKEALTGQEQQQQHLPLFFKLLTAPAAAAAATGQQQRPPHAFREEEASDVRGSSSRSRRRRSEQEEELHQEVRSWFESGAKEGPVGEEQGEAAAAEGAGAEAAAESEGPCASQAP